MYQVKREALTSLCAKSYFHGQYGGRTRDLRITSYSDEVTDPLVLVVLGWVPIEI